MYEQTAKTTSTHNEQLNLAWRSLVQWNRIKTKKMEESAQLKQNTTNTYSPNRTEIYNRNGMEQGSVRKRAQKVSETKCLSKLLSKAQPCHAFGINNSTSIDFPSNFRCCCRCYYHRWLRIHLYMYSYRIEGMLLNHQHFLPSSAELSESSLQLCAFFHCC